MNLTLTTDRLTISASPEVRAAIAEWAQREGDAMLEPLSLTIDLAAPAQEEPGGATEEPPAEEPTQPPAEPDAPLTLWHLNGDEQRTRQVWDGDKKGRCEAVVEGADRVVFVAGNRRIKVDGPGRFIADLPAGPIDVEARAGAKLEELDGVPPIKVTLV